MKLLGYHVNATLGGIPELVAVGKPAVVVVLDGGPEWSWVIDSSPNTKFLWRGYVEREPDFSSTNFDPIREASAYVTQSIARMGGVKWDYVLGPNEPVIETEIAMKNLAAFEVERARLLRGHGYGAAIGTFSVGNPADMSLLKFFLPAIEAIHKYKGVLSLHQYGPPEDIKKDAPWLILRHRKFYYGEPSQGWPGLPSEYRNTPLVITETGGDQLIYSSDPGGWSLYQDPEDYVEQLTWLDNELLKDGYVIGAAIYCCGNISGKWVTYDIWQNPARSINGMLSPTYRTPQYVTEASGDHALGVDVSYAQRLSINWKELNKDYAIVRSSYRKKIDSKFSRHYYNARGAGLLVGMYHFLYHTPSAYEQGQFFATLVKKHSPDLPPVVDVEIPPGNVDTATANDVMSFVHGFKSMCDLQLFVYTNIGSWNKIMKGHYNFVNEQNLGLFVADWGDVEEPRLPKPWKSWVFWQYKVEPNGIPGYNGRIDLNKFVGDVTMLYALYGAGGKGC